MSVVENQISPPSDRRDAILQEVANALRLANDGASSIEAILATTDVSTREVDLEFGGTDGLVIALVELIVDCLLAPLDEIPTKASFMPQLVEFGRGVTVEYANPRLGTSTALP